jgi:hypothetical protein
MSGMHEIALGSILLLVNCCAVKFIFYGQKMPGWFIYRSQISWRRFYEVLSKVEFLEIAAGPVSGRWQPSL